jgi:fibro-slime domain-containing protein
MSWSSPVRVLGICCVWLAVQTGCGGNPSISTNDPGTNGGTGGGGKSATAGTGAGGFVITTGGDDGEGGGTDQPVNYVCGNAELEPGEFCDDGNTADGDGCSGDCAAVDPDFDCSAVGQTCVQVVICGNGVLEGDELCDDKNTLDGDGCSADCGTVEEGWVCVRPGQPCVGVSVCGNGVRERGEACDDGQAPASNDGCDEQCQIEAGFYCPNPGQLCVQQVCGDGVRTPGEACDDHDTNDNDGCSHLCVVEAGWHCNAMGCKAECGDGLVVPGEGCDDGNAVSADGCSSACKVEPFFKCDAAQPSKCTASNDCGNGVLEPIFDNTNKVIGHEICDPPSAATGCNAGCTDVTPVVTPPVCGNSQIEGTETCDPPAVGNGCGAACKVEAGWSCPQPGVCFKNPTCGDNIVQSSNNETCDPPQAGKGCDVSCKIESGWTCVGLGPSTCVKPACGNGVIETGEKCDDKNAVNNDGCTACAIDSGWACPAQGVPCIAVCGDGKKLGLETCDDGNKTSGDGCNSGCKVEVGFSCPTVGAKCVASVCGDKSLDAGEGCDDGGLCFGGSAAGTACTKDSNCTGGGLCKTVAGDGCGPTCQPEPTVTVGSAPTVNVFCGDGLKTGTEVCDDGNTTDGDGCQGDCKSVTSGWTCTGKLTLPTSLQMQVTYRDFKQRSSTVKDLFNNTGNGHPDFEHDNNTSAALNIPGPACVLGNTQCLAAAGSTCAAGTCGWLDAQGKPVLHQPNETAEITNANTFSLWYRDDNPTNIAGDDGAIEMWKLTSSLTLNQVGGATSEVYEYDNSNFFPLTGLGFGNDGNTKNFHFTTELRYFFQYKGGEKLIFRGDDDVWVFINGRLAVDVGGVHCAELGQVILGDEDSTCSLHRADYTDNNPGGNFSIAACATTGDPAACNLSVAEQADTTDGRFGLTKGNVYEIVLFHAERHTSQSNFRLTLAGFLAPRSSCSTSCGDGILAGDEFCDDGMDPNTGNSDTRSGACNTSCTARAYCGDGTRQLPGEACDNGTNTDLYKTAASPASVCAPGCKVPASCGDGVLQASFEQCDKGGQNDDTSYGPTSCTTACKLGGYCGDGTTQGAEGEACDLGANNGKTWGPASCGYDCQPGKRCGDGILNDSSEKCDDGAMNGSITSHCSVSCTIVPYCGDGDVKAPEQCDWGQFGTDPPDYGGCSTMCTLGPQCGDGNTDPEEECDDGAGNNSSTYDGCTTKCALGPHCGDGVKQSPQESCDNGFNADDYDDPKTPEAECGPNCTPPPFCGDMIVQASHELCDNGAANDDDTYEGCTTLCDFGPYCGDAQIDPQGGEVCDDGLDNVGYSAVQGGCSYDCQPAPYCGDAERNGPEQCDLGAAENTGAYGTCNADCTFAPRCGDGVMQGSEQCDDGPSGSLGCTPTCKRRVVVQ